MKDSISTFGIERASNHTYRTMKVIDHLRAMGREWYEFDIITWGGMLAVTAAALMLLLTLEVVGAVIAFLLILAWAHLDTIRRPNSGRAP